MDHQESNDCSDIGRRLTLVPRRSLNDKTRRLTSAYHRMVLPKDRRSHSTESNNHHKRPDRLRYSYHQLMRLQTFAERQRANLCVREAVRLVRTHRNLPEDFWQSRRRFSFLVRGRQLVIYLAHVVAQVSMHQLSALTNLDRKTIRYGLGKIEDEREDMRFDHEVERLSERYLDSLKHRSVKLSACDPLL